MHSLMHIMVSDYTHFEMEITCLCTKSIRIKPLLVSRRVRNVV
jgi:hypothetical protein